ncbi:MAG: right-handed parallel beta-helix repeat-containing protein, partial [Bacteroidetes bacterium]|nr:right-handed parallel beta-helix repeat-containing protein [Bacteroidota bacterium]
MKTKILQTTLLTKSFLILYLLLAMTDSWALPSAIHDTYVNGSTGNDLWNGSYPTYQGGTVGPKATIQAAINAAGSGYVIHVAAGTYTEQLNIDKSITIQGAGSSNTHIISPAPSGMTIYDSYGSKSPDARYISRRAANIPLVRIVASNVVFDGFHVNMNNQIFLDIKGSYAINYCKGVGILIDHVETTPGTPDVFTGIQVINNQVDGMSFGDQGDAVKILGSATALISSNIIYDYGVGGISAQAVDLPIRAAYYPSVTINGNTIYGGIGSGTRGNTDFLGIGYWSGATGTANLNTILNTPDVYSDNTACGSALNAWTPRAVSFTNNTVMLQGGGTGLGWGGQFFESSNLILSGNTIVNQEFAGAVLYNPILTISGNTIQNNTDGFLVDNQTSGSVTMTNNSFTGTATGHYAVKVGGEAGTPSGTTYGAWNGLSTVIVNAHGNWWGDASGAKQTSTNPSGTGSEVTDLVSYVPWLGLVPGSVPMTYVTNNEGSIADVIAIAQDGDRIEIRAGSYTETITVNKHVTLAPGASPGCVDVTGDFTLISGSTLEMEVNGTTACTQYDKITVSGTVTLGGATLSLPVGYIPLVGDYYTLIDGSSAIVGQFAQGTSITVGSYVFSINYAGGGDGFDVVVTMTGCVPGLVHNTSLGTSYCFIQDAINHASPGNTITVDNGTFNEHVIINKANLTLKNTTSATPVINGAGTGTVVTITANGVTFDGFNVQNSGSNPAADAGVKLDNITGCTVIRNTVTGNANGIVELTGSGNFMSSNTVNTNTYYGIAIVAGIGNTINLNTISGNGLDAIALDNASVGGGPVTMGSTGNFIRGNNITSNRDGIFLGENCDNNQITNTNQINSATGTGVNLWRSDGQTITDNVIQSASIGIRLLGSSNNTITGNTVTSNGVGVKIDPSWQSGVWYQCLNNTISQNNMSGNTNFGMQADNVQQVGDINAVQNWWGAASGPYNTPNNTCGTGNSVTANINFMPWWTTSTGGSGLLGVNNTTLGRYYCKIQDAIDGANPGNTITVDNGTFNEHIIINKANLTVKNTTSATPVINGSGTGTVVAITANGVTFEGFNVQNSGNTQIDVGILLGTVTGPGTGTGVTGCTVQNNTLTTNVQGIVLAFSSTNTIKSNTLTANGTNPGFGILLGASSSNTIESNIISNEVASGIYLDNESVFGGSSPYSLGSTSNTINLNTINNTTSGESLNLGEICNSNIVTTNTIDGGSYGIHIWKSNLQTITGNIIHNCTIQPGPGKSAVAIRLRNAQNNNITDNTITLNMKGFEIVANEAPYCTGNTIHQNNISSNGSGMDASPSLGNYIVDATNNYWGAASGPYNTPNNTCGTGNSVTAYVNFMPWWTTSTGGSGLLGVNNTTLGRYYCEIQDAINDAITGDVIKIAGGTYLLSVDATGGKNITLSPGSSPACVTISGLAIDAGDVLDMEVNGTTACDDYDKFIVNGDVSLGGASLNFILGYAPSSSDVYTILDKTTPGAITGTFSGLAEGAFFTADFSSITYSFKISYVGGDGNDVVITYYNEATALSWLQANTILSSVSGTIADMTATFPASIPPVIIAAPYQINSRITLGGDAIPTGSTLDIQVTIDGAGPFPYVTGASIPSSPFWVTDLFTPAATPADFDAGYGGHVEIYSITINSAGGNPLALNGTALIESIISKNGFSTNTVLDDISLTFTIPPDEAAALAWLQANTILSSVSGTIADMTATFPASIPPVIVSAPYQINSRITLGGDAIPTGSTLDIQV